MKLLHIDASILGQNSVSRQLSAAIVQRLSDAQPGLEVSHTDLGPEGLNISPERREAAIAAATAEAARLAA